MGQRGLKVVDGAPSDGGALLTPKAKARMWEFNLPDLLRQVGETAPFTVGAAGVGPKMSGTRLAETLIISAITGAVVIIGTIYVAQPVTDTKLAHLSEKITEMHGDMKALKEQVTDLSMQQKLMEQNRRKE